MFPFLLGPLEFGADAPLHSSSDGKLLFEQHEFAKAVEFFSSELKGNPNDLEALLYLGRIAFEENHLEEGVRYFSKATELAPSDSMSFLWLGRILAMQAKELGAPRGMFPARKARKALERAVELDPNNSQARVDLITYYREAPGIVGGSLHAAQNQANELAKRDPYLGTVAKGDVALGEKEYELANRSYRAAIELQPKSREAYLRLGALALRTKQYDQAFAAYDRMLELDPNDKQALFQIGKTADLSNQQLERGEAALKTYLQCQPFYVMPKLTWAHRRLGNIYLKRGLRDLARQEYDAAMALDPSDKEASLARKRLDEAPAH